MKLRKILATSLAIAMAVATINVAPAKADVIDSQTAYLDKDVYDVTVPTTGSQKFYLDPQGLADEAFKNDANAGGKIIGATTMSAINNSSKPVNFEIVAAVIASSAAVTVVTDSALLTGLDNVGSGPALSLKITTTNAKNSKAVTKGGITAPDALSSADDLAVAISGAATSSAIYGLAAGDYVVTASAITAGAIKDQLYNPNNYKYEMNASGAAIDLVIGGACTKNTDWSDFVGAKPKQELKLDITFKLTKEDKTTEITLGPGFKYDKTTRTLSWTSSDVTALTEFNMTNAAGTFNAVTTSFPDVYSSGVVDIANKTFVVDTRYAAFFTGVQTVEITYTEGGVSKTTTHKFTF